MSGSEHGNMRLFHETKSLHFQKFSFLGGGVFKDFSIVIYVCYK